jgi:hypothetical protein
MIHENLMCYESPEILLWISPQCNERMVLHNNRTILKMKVLVTPSCRRFLTTMIYRPAAPSSDFSKPC